MTKQIELLKVTRNNILTLISSYSEEQLNRIPLNFNNNLIWNAGHVIVSQQLLIYRRSGVDCKVPEELIKKYSRGTKPEGTVEQSEIGEIKEWLWKTPTYLEEDYYNDLFQQYEYYKTQYGFGLSSVDDALMFNNIHESLHLGFMLALRKEL